MEPANFKTYLLPTLTVNNAVAAIAFYKTAFGATELMRATSPDGDTVAELAIGDARIVVADESPSQGNLGPDKPNAVSVRIGLMVADPDATAAAAIAAGAREIYAVADQDYGYRLGHIVDPFGHHWEIGRPL